MIRFFICCFSCLLLLHCSPVKHSKPTTSLIAEDDSLYTLVERQTFNYFWEGAEPHSGMARERIHLDNVYPQNDKNVITSGGSGFGIMNILVGIEKGFISRIDGIKRLEQIVSFLEKADCFHGAFPHWWFGETGKVKPFSRKDNGGDLVETSYLMQGLLCARQYLKKGNQNDNDLAKRIDQLWRKVEFDWFTNGQNVLYWHWSPEYKWEMNFPVQGYNECLIMYILAASSPTHSIKAEVYHQGWARSGSIRKITNQYGFTLQLLHNGDSIFGGPLFWAQYSYLGLDPRGLKDRYADYWQENRNQALINYSWCVENPYHYVGYGKDSWGLTASYSPKGYAAHAPGPKDLGVIAPTAALSSMPYTPSESIKAMRHWYNDLKQKLWGDYGFYDAFSETEKWFPKRYLAIDQGPIVIMMENYRSGLLWKLFMSCPEIHEGLKKLDFTSPWLQTK